MIANIKCGMLLSEIAQITNGVLYGEDKIIYSISTDSREVGEKCLFFAIKGEKFDGHDFVRVSAEKGMSAYVCQYIPEGCEQYSVVVVSDVILALGALAREYKSRFDILTVAVTGSVGKTTTKEFIYSVLSQKYKTVKTQGNHNNHIGLPMTLFSIDESTECAVIEMGMSSRGEIEYLSGIACPDIAVITNVGTSHIERLGSREQIALAKLEILCGLKENGVLFVNGDEPLLDIDRPKIKIGRDPSSDFSVDHTYEGEYGCSFDIVTRDILYESVVIPAFGEHNVMNACFAFAVGKWIGMGEYEIRRGLLSYHTTGMRQNVYNKKGRTVIEDCYNASPESMMASIKVLADMAKRENKRAVAVLGNMLELGEYSAEGHRRVGAFLALSGISMLVTFGADASEIARAASDFGADKEKIFMFENTEDIIGISEFVLKNTDENDIILFKGSRGVRLERVIEYIKAN